MGVWPSLVKVCRAEADTRFAMSQRALPESDGATAEPRLGAPPADEEVAQGEDADERDEPGPPARRRIR